MELPWWVWIVIGLPVIIISSMLDMVLFMLFGVVFTIIGIALLVNRIVLKPREGPVQKKFCPRCFLSLPLRAKQCPVCGKHL